MEMTTIETERFYEPPFAEVLDVTSHAIMSTSVTNPFDGEEEDW